MRRRFPDSPNSLQHPTMARRMLPGETPSWLNTYADLHMLSIEYNIGWAWIVLRGATKFSTPPRGAVLWVCHPAWTAEQFVNSVADKQRQVLISQQTKCREMYK